MSTSESLARTGRFHENPLVRPATELWLTEHRYTFRSEVRMPLGGVADYIATHTDGLGLSKIIAKGVI